MPKKAQNREGITKVKATADRYPAIVEALCDPDKRKKLVKIYESLKAHDVEKEVRYGIWGPTFEGIGELLEITGKE